MEGITDEQNTILQRIAWEADLKYRHAGVDKWPFAKIAVYGKQNQRDEIPGLRNEKLSRDFIAFR